MSKEDLTIQYYNDHAESFFENTVNLDMTQFHHRFLGYLPEGGTILDAGCGSGRDAKAFVGAGFQVEAFDASERLTEIARKLVGPSVPVHVLRFQEIGYEDQFDGIWACASLVHVPKADLAPVFAQLNRALKPLGHLYASFKYGEGVQTRNGRIFIYMSESSLAQITSGFEQLESWVTSDVRPGRSSEKWLNVILRKK